MQNQDNKFEILTKEACNVLALSYQVLTDRYKDYPICLMQYIEKGVDEQIIEVRFDNHSATVSLSFDKETNCDSSFLFFDSLEDEDTYIEHLRNYAEYDFKWSCWTITNCFLKIKPTKDETTFYFYR